MSEVQIPLGAHHRGGSSLRVAPLLVPPIVAGGAFLTQAVLKFPVGSWGAFLTAAGFILGSALAFWPLFAIARRIIYIPQARAWPHYTALALNAVALVPVMAFGTATLANL
jgi:hypothetical protein